MKHFDYIFTGSGLSALLTVYRMTQSCMHSGKSILLIDSDSKKTNDRTWCFWEDKQSEFESIIFRKWKTALFASQTTANILDLSPYEYKMIHGLDFYNFVLGELSKFSNVVFLNQKVSSFHDDGNQVTIETNEDTFICTKLLNSILSFNLPVNQEKYPLLQQHFIGWIVKSKQPVFNPDCPTFMDFSIPQKGNTRFMYVLPFSETEALVEYTLFSKDLLPTDEYEQAIRDYITNLGITEFEIISEEQGNIPMTCFPFWKSNSKNILHIGSAGGWTKASTGYTFKSSLKKSIQLEEFLGKDDDFRNFHRRNKFWFYDLLLLDILDKKNWLGSRIFNDLFKLGNPTLILKFLDEETNLAEDLQVILKCPTIVFIKALIQRLAKSF